MRGGVYADCALIGVNGSYAPLEQEPHDQANTLLHTLFLPFAGLAWERSYLLETYRLRMRMDFAGAQWVAGSGAPIAMYSQIEVGCGTGSPCNRKPSM